jgi:hypothetical protein
MSIPPNQRIENLLLKVCLGIGLTSGLVSWLGAWLVQRYPLELSKPPWHYVFRYGLLITILAAFFLIPLASIMLSISWWANQRRT